MVEKYSVLMSVYDKDNPEWLSTSIESMLNQTITTDDFVIVEDGKLKNDLEEVINRFTNKYPKMFNIIKLEKNGGLGFALQTGIKQCKNELIARMDADDYCISTRCEKQLKQFEKNSNLAIVGTSVIEFENNIENVISYRNMVETNEQIQKFIKKRNPFAHPSVMFKKSEVIKAGNYQHCYLCEDYDLWIRMIKNGVECFNIKEYLTYMRVNDNFYKRRGGIKFLKSITSFKNKLYKSGFLSKKDYLHSLIGYSVICIVPNFIRKKIYMKFLRS